jgi:uncharacterized membrane protein YiaA
MNKFPFAKNLLAFVALVLGFVLYGLGALYISEPSFGLYWARPAAEMVTGTCLILVSLRIMWRQRDP